MTCPENSSSRWPKIGEHLTLSAFQGSPLKMEQPKPVDIDRRVTNLPSDPKELRGSTLATKGLGRRHHHHQ